MNRESYELMELLEQNHWWFVSRRKIIKKILDKFITKNTNNNILEINLTENAIIQNVVFNGVKAKKVKEKLL